MGRTIPFADDQVAATFAGYPPAIRRKLMQLRALILATAAIEDAGEIEETLKWGEPAYLTRSRTGSTLRLAWKPARPDYVGFYVNCQTDLIESFRHQFPDDFTFEGNRAILFDVADGVPREKLAICIAAALTYHRRKKRAVGPRRPIELAAKSR
jgi:hypothetical protein